MTVSYVCGRTGCLFQDILSVMLGGSPYGQGGCLTLATRFTIYDFGYEVDAGGVLHMQSRLFGFVVFTENEENCSG